MEKQSGVYSHQNAIRYCQKNTKRIFQYNLALPKEDFKFHLHQLWHEHGFLGLGMWKEASKEEYKILQRFTKVFQQTYTRFLDLQKAEAQTREAQIEAALEKVRSRTMAMQKGEEVKDVVVLLYKELIALGVTNFVTCGYVEINEETSRQATWVTNPGGDSLGLFHLPLTGDVHFDNRYEAWKKQQTVFHQTVAGKERRKHLEYAITTFNSKEAEEMVLNQFPDPTVFYCFNFSHGYLHLVAGSQLKKEEEALLARFTKVFEQTYARFLDLEKAAAQTREAQINLAVERVRAKALAMHKSEEIMDVVAKLKDEVMSLDIPDVVAATIFLNEGDDKVRMWDLSTLDINDTNDYEVPFDITFKLKKSDPHLYVKRVWENTDDYFIEIQNKKDFKRIIAWLRENNRIKIANEVEDYTESTQLKQLYHAVKKLNNGKLVIDLLDPPSDEMETILTKMGGAFDLAYKRFQDLQKAEAQTREAQIETALERVRSRSMAMHNSEELLEVINVVSEQLQELDFKFVHVSFANNDNSEEYKFWTAAKGLSKPMRFTTPYLDIAVFNNLRAAQEKSDSFCTDVITKKEHNKWHTHLLKHGGSKVFSKEDNAFIMSRGMARSTAINPNIMLILANYASIPYSEDENKIIERFGQVFEQSYTRFLDLQKAEQQTREAQIETALEKVRSRTMAMQHSDELPEAANNLFLQVQELGIPAWSAGYCIWEDESKTSASCNMSSEGEIQKAFSLPTIGEGYNFYDPYKKGETFHVSECGGENLVKHYEFMKKLPTVGVILEELEKAGISLPTFQIFHIVFLKFGYVMFITYETVPDAHHIFKRFGQVFEQTYTRFLDLKLKEDQAVKLKEEKQRLEKTLKNLQQTQTQLIQSEKMASLGELTAGIAHEIQNPLNFVNNFSEVSKELLEEMLEEIEAGDMEEAKAIMADVVQNLDKINHHGKRADGIVKGMLQHSRASGDKKEATDINALADEYLRLAYHGLRAKDNSFNAQLVTDFDESITTVDVIPQDLGRVVLNLLTNAFYACTERSRSMVNENKKSGLENYEPTVSISTKKIKDTLEIKVTDNGNGIPTAIMEKIFQPFFTTKPTGQGTGLGLSMSYDIITKGHGGELKAETKEGEGTTFTIQLPNE